MNHKTVPRTPLFAVEAAFSLTVHEWSTAPNVVSTASTSIKYFNALVLGWEHVVEPINLEAFVESSADGATTGTVNLSEVQVNISQELIRTVAALSGSPQRAPVASGGGGGGGGEPSVLAASSAASASGLGDDDQFSPFTMVNLSGADVEVELAPEFVAGGEGEAVAGADAGTAAAAAAAADGAAGGGTVPSPALARAAELFRPTVVIAAGAGETVLPFSVVRSVDAFAILRFDGIEPAIRAPLRQVGDFMFPVTVTGRFLCVWVCVCVGVCVCV